MCTESAPLYSTDRKDFFFLKSRCSLHKGDRLTGNVACLCSLLQSAGGNDRSTFQRRLPSSEWTLSLQLCGSEYLKRLGQAHQLPPAEPVKMQKRKNLPHPLHSPCYYGDRPHTSWGGNWTGINWPLKALVLLASHRRLVLCSFMGVDHCSIPSTNDLGENPKYFFSAKNWSVYPQ